MGLPVDEAGDDPLNDLVERCRQGERQAAGELFARYRDRVRRFCLSFAPVGVADASDLTQEVFVRAFSNIGRLREIDKFESWLMTIARRQCLSFCRKQGASRRDSKRWAEEARLHRTDDLDGEAMREAERQVVREEIERLPDSQLKTVGELFYLRGLDTARIADRLGVPQSTVTTWTSRFRARIRKRLLLRILAMRGAGGRHG